MNQEALDFINGYCDFSNPNWVWILTGISRNKDHLSNFEKFMTRKVISSAEEIVPAYQDILLFANNPNTKYRIYISLNARDVVKTALEFQKRLFDINIGLAKGYNDALSLAKRIGSVWKTELAQTCNRGTKRILLDLDSQDELHFNGLMQYINDPLFLNTTKLHAVRKTVSGYHIVIDACDTRQLMAYCKEWSIPIDSKQLQRDSMVFVEQLNGNS